MEQEAGPLEPAPQQGAQRGEHPRDHWIPEKAMVTGFTCTAGSNSFASCTKAT
jgi:hypothetical protein